MEFVKKIKKELVLAGLLVLMFVGLFLPYIYYNDSFELGYQAIFGHGFNWIIFILILPYILLGVSIGFVAYHQKHYVLPPLAILMSLIALTLFIFVPSFYAYLIGASESDCFLNVGPILLAFYCAIIAIFAYSFVDRKNRYSKISVYEMVGISIFVAIAVVLDMFAQIDIGATGGSIGFAMLPLMIITMRHGPIKGFVASGIIFGFITCLTDGWGFVYFPFDYLLGFGSIALLGIFNKWTMPKDDSKVHAKGVILIIVGVILVMIGRTIASSISSMLFYGYNLTEAIIYQMTYVPGACGASLIVLLLLYKPLLIVNKRYNVKKSDELN